MSRLGVRTYAPAAPGTQKPEFWFRDLARSDDRLQTGPLSGFFNEEERARRVVSAPGVAGPPSTDLETSS
jgi:hypothetical protein